MDLKESMLLWIPGIQESTEETSDLIVKVTEANRAVIDFLDAEISFDDMLEIVDYYGANVDDYRATLDNNFREFGA